MPVPPVTGLQLPQYVRSALLMEYHGDGMVGVPFGSLQAIASEGGGKNRLMTEVCILSRVLKEALLYRK